MEKLYFKVSRDPIYSEIFLYPLEIVIADTPLVQRLRYLSQLAGAEYVYPSATHTRFSHSLGVMHIAGLYANKLFEDNHQKIRIIRLAGLVHDLGHGPYSHQFDDVIYKRMGLDDGHDEYRKKILNTKLIEQAYNVYKKLNDSRTKKDFLKDLSLTVKREILDNEKEIKEALKEVMNMINELFEAENTGGSPEFNIVQGPLGADRLDFVLRDSYYAGTRDFGTGDLDRIIRNASIKTSNGKEKLCYNIKIIDNIYTVLFARFMMYKNVYFHKTSRAADQMIQEILRLADDILDIKSRVEDLDKFVSLTDQRIINEIEMVYEELYEKKNNELFSISPELMQKSDKVAKAYELVKRLKSRDLWKLLIEIPFSTTGLDPSVISVSVAENVLKQLKTNIEKTIKTDIPKEDKQELSYILDNFENLFIIDTPYKLSLMHPKEFLSSDVSILDYNGDILRFDEVFERYPAYKFMESNLIQISRIYLTEDKREILRKYDLVPKIGGINLTTRW
ncbi:MULTISPECIES: HD domain-containing protein [unclassified Marinitoga]|uniref:HD domain-containing protein n=1 Tax=unclassified Marinitoga TaxID=2640159 RepID=UPI000950404A|nr:MULTISPECIES: HD domain-containing protein [unclassified Marinitoga]APT76125.1 metal-dependent phosphohydrolase [Marinitoga sp. 1137]NUU97790.1 metal-dependent phosphohydrolase [Marinitoga sp. 1138]